MTASLACHAKAAALPCYPLVQHVALPPALPRSSTLAPCSTGRAAHGRCVAARATSRRTEVSLASARAVTSYDVDKELWEALDMCTDEELVELHAIMYEPSPFSPVVKSIVAEAEPAAIEYRGRSSLMYKLENRFRFLAADSISTFRGRRPSYRQTLTNVHSALEVPCPATLGTQDMELEIFLHVMRDCQEFLEGIVDADRAQEAAAAFAAVGEGDGMASFTAPPKQGGLIGRITAPLRLGAKTLVPTLVRLGGAFTLDTLQREAMRSLAAHVVQSQFQYRAALSTLCSGAGRVCAGRQAAVKAAQQGLTRAASTYGMARGALAMLGPLMWATLAAELAMKSVGTDYARIVRAICVLAQARLLRTGGWQLDEAEEDAFTTDGTTNGTSASTSGGKEPWEFSLDDAYGI